MIENLVTADELYQIYNIDLSSYLGVKGQTNNTTVADNYIAEKQDLIFQYIASFRWRGIADIPLLIKNVNYLQAIQTAVRQQIVYEVRSGVDLSTASRVYIDSDKIMTVENDLLEKEMIARTAKNTLHNCQGLLCARRM